MSVGFFIQMFVLAAVVFVGLVVVLRQVIGRHANTATSHLQGLAQDYLSKQEELKKRLEEVEKQYQDQLAKAKQEAEQLKVQAQQEVELSRKQIVSQAQREAEKIVQRAMETQGAIEAGIKQTFKEEVVETSCQLVDRALPEVLRKEMHTIWVKKLLNGGLGRLEGKKGDQRIDQVSIRSAFPLTADERQLLTKHLEAEFGKSITVKEAKDPSLVVGIIIVAGAIVMDGSLGSKIRQAVREMRDKDAA